MGIMKKKRSVFATTDEPRKGKSMNAISGTETKFQLNALLRKTWNHLAGILGRRVPPSEDREKYLGKIYSSLLCAVSGKSWDDTKAMEFSVKEAKSIIACFTELTEDVGGESGPGIPFEQITAAVGIRAANLKLERLHGKFEEAAPKKRNMNRKHRCLPPIGTSVWCGNGNVLLEVVPTPIRYCKVKERVLTYRPEGGRALLVLNGERAGAFNSAPTALATAIYKGARVRNGWAAMLYDPANLGSGEVSAAANVILASDGLYLCEAPGDGMIPVPRPQTEELAKRFNVGKPCPDGAVLLENYSEPLAKTAEPVAPDGKPDAKEAPVAQPPTPTAPVDFTEMLKQLRELLPVASERDNLMAAVRRYNEILPKATEFESLKLKFRQFVAQEQKRLSDDYIAKKFDLADLTRKLAELEDVAREF
jgi:hypothetical protein